MVSGIQGAALAAGEVQIAFSREITTFTVGCYASRAAADLPMWAPGYASLWMKNFIALE